MTIYIRVPIILGNIRYFAVVTNKYCGLVPTNIAFFVNFELFILLMKAFCLGFIQALSHTALRHVR